MAKPKIRTDSVPVTGPYPEATRPNLSLVPGTNSEQDDDTKVSFGDDGEMQIEHPDGSVTIDFNPKEDGEEDEEGFHANLAKQIPPSELESIASDLLEGIKQDEDSRKEWLDTRALGISLLGAKLERPRTDAGSSSAPLEGMSTVRHPLLMEATVTFQATARAELLPASGPVKVRNDSPSPPANVTPETNATQELADSLQGKDELAQALEKDMNHYLTDTAVEYVPDTDRMLFYVGFGGDGFKKVYNCPLRRRPVSESVDAEDLIVSNHATDLHSSGRITHRIRMRKSILKRMQIIGAYRDVDLLPPPPPSTDPVKQQKEEIAGVRSAQLRPEDRDYEIYEVYCELDLDEFAPDQFKGKGLPLPYRVTIEKESRQVLDVRRNWDEDDDQCIAKRYFAQYPFIRGLGFYGLGFIHLLGNTTNALTAAWRETLDAGMFANFPGFLYAKGAGRQLSNQMRVPAGGGVGLDIGAQMNIRDAVMPLPYKEPGAAFVSFIQNVENVGRRLAATGNVSVGEGKQDAPVGTTLALIEQASKVIDSAHKRLHAAQSEEFKLLKERFREDPEAFWRHNKSPTLDWKKEQFVEALNTYELVPVADPNNPTSLHRIAKAMAIKTLQQQSPDLYDPIAVDMRVMRIVDIDPQGLFRPTPAAPPPDPRMEAINAKAQAEQNANQIKQLELQIKAAESAARTQDKERDRQSRERIEALKIQRDHLKLAQEQLIHARDVQREDMQSQNQMQMDNLAQQHEMQGGRVKTQHELDMDHERHAAQLRRDDEEHSLKMRHLQELHEHRLASAEQMAKMKTKTAKKPKSSKE